MRTHSTHPSEPLVGAHDGWLAVPWLLQNIHHKRRESRCFCHLHATSARHLVIKPAESSPQPSTAVAHVQGCPEMNFGEKAHVIMNQDFLLFCHKFLLNGLLHLVPKYIQCRNKSDICFSLWFSHQFSIQSLSIIQKVFFVCTATWLMMDESFLDSREGPVLGRHLSNSDKNPF